MIEYRIRRGNGVCEYSGNKSPVLIQLVDSEGNPSGWMGMDALSEALSLLNALNGMAPQLTPVTPDFPIQQSVVASPVPAQSQAAETRTQTKAKAKLSVRDEIALESFVKECQNIVDNPPADRNGNAQGVPGYAVRDLVNSWRGRFQAGDEVMVPTLKTIFGVPDGQIQFLMGKMD
jgi:hypothetical protein